MTDAAGKPLHLGDIVASNRDGYTSELGLFLVVGFTNQKVELAEAFGRTLWGRDYCLKYPEQVSKVEL